jgi:predicted PurR-regulated permease PerM
MRFITYPLSLLRPVHLLISALVLVLFILISIAPVQAAPTSKSMPTDGTAQLDKILEKSEDVSQSRPMSLEEVQQRANEGINEVQGAADKEKMVKSKSSKPILARELEKALDKAGH